MNKLQGFEKRLKRGQVYRRADLAKWSNAVDRHLAQLVDAGTLQKLSQGVYYYPKETVFGMAPPDEATLVRAFLKDDDFLITSPNAYNALGVGTTQLYNKRVVYNYKRHGEFDLGGMKFFFHKRPRVPSKLTQEFLLVDLVNNLDSLAEDLEEVLPKVERKAAVMEPKKLLQAVKRYGGVKARNFFMPLLEQNEAKRYV